MTTTAPIDAYLGRIGFTHVPKPSQDTLRALHRAHLLAVPFENLDIHLGREIVLDDRRLLAKIVGEGRGGFCYELNGAFGWLLRALGFDVTLLSAGVATSEGGFGPDFDHLLLRIDLDESWLADVGFGDCFLEPIRLSGEVQREGSRAFRLDFDGEWRVLSQRDGEGDWRPQHRFTLTPRTLEEFAEMCRYHQTSPDSHFTRSRICSRATPAGRISLTRDRLIISEDGRREERPIVDDTAYADALRDRFGIVLPTD
jgi:N-hydroxyarylamine O-acetyltransferase